jgi:arylsulfatase B
MSLCSTANCAGFLDNGCYRAAAAVTNDDSYLVDFLDADGPSLSPASPSINGSDSAELFAARAAEWIAASASEKDPFLLYFAPMNVHIGLHAKLDGPVVQASASVIKQYYAKTAHDTYKVMGGMLTSLDSAVGTVVRALKSAGVYDNTAIVFVSDNGGNTHTGSANAPFRGGKFGLYEGGVRVVGFLSGGLVPPARRGGKWDGIMHTSDWYITMLAAARVDVPPTRPGARPIDGFNLWHKILSGRNSSRTDVVIQVRLRGHVELECLMDCLRSAES